MALLGPWVSTEGRWKSTSRAGDTEDSPGRDGGNLKGSGEEEWQTGGKKREGIPGRGPSTGKGEGRGWVGEVQSVGRRGAMGVTAASWDSGNEGLKTHCSQSAFPLSMHSFI